MSRPSGNTDQRLIDAARELVPKTGLSGLKLRDVARAAGVNLGMFHYHFKTKKAFTRRLLRDIYEEFFARLSMQAGGEGRPIERLARALGVFGRFARDNRRLFLFLLMEAMRGEPETLACAREMMPRHVLAIAGLIGEAQRAGELKEAPLPLALSFAMGSVGAPNVVYAIRERAGGASTSRGPFDWGKDFISDDAIDMRVGLVLKALAPERKGRSR